MNWSDEPATERQMMLLRNAGFVPSGPLSLTEAARLIRQHQRGVPLPRISVLKRSQRQSDPGPTAVLAGSLSESAKVAAYRLHTAVENALRAMAEAPNAPNVRADMASAASHRQEFWMDTCREVEEMQEASLQVLEFYQLFGCRFSPPSRAQVQEIFDALDSALPHWERDHPELFYQTLELNFPHLLNRR